MTKNTKLFVVLGMVASTFLAAVPTVSAAPSFDITTVRGQVIGPNNEPLKNAAITVTCDGDTKRGRTNGQGKYKVVFFGRNTCDKGDVATITAEKDGVSGSTTGIVDERKDGRFVDRNFLVAQNINVPEFGLIPGAVAALTSAGAILTMRRRRRG